MTTYINSLLHTKKLYIFYSLNILKFTQICFFFFYHSQLYSHHRLFLHANKIYSHSLQLLQTYFQIRPHVLIPTVFPHYFMLATKKKGSHSMIYAINSLHSMTLFCDTVFHHYCTPCIIPTHLIQLL